ncbi:MAG: flap endonuclease-1, partial [Candidatus Nanohaloarchaea archaeon]
IIRQRDGTPLKDSSGNITSHLSGVFYRNINLLENNIRPIYIFDGETPELKSKESSRRKKKRREAREKWKKLKEEGKVDEAYTKATQSSKLTGDMIEEAKNLLDVMGIPYIQAPSEGEAQAAYMVKETGEVYAVGSQDWDCLLFGADRMVRNLTNRKTRKTSSGGKKEISTELIALESVLDQLGVSQEKLIWMGVLMGTDFNPDGIEGIGPKTAYKLVQEYESFEKLSKDEKFDWESDKDPKTIIEFFKEPPVVNADYQFEEPDIDGIRKLLVDKHDFSEKRVSSKLEDLQDALKSRQSGLDSFT